MIEHLASQYLSLECTCVYTHTDTDPCSYTLMCTHIQKYEHAQRHTDMHIHKHTQRLKWINTYTERYAHRHAQIHTHTHKHI